MRGKTFTLFMMAVLINTGLLFGQTAKVQIIHNSADGAAASVDIYLDGSKLLDDFAFRSATSFIDAPADVAVDIGVAPSHSSGVHDTIFNKSVTFASGETYVVVANGIISGSGYHPAPDFDLYVFDMGRMEAGSAGETDVLVFHGSTDAPTVDVAEPNAQLKLLDDVSYGEFTGDYLNLATADYSLQVQNMYGSEAVAQFDSPLQTLGLEDSALVVVASGFLDPASNSHGPAFGLYAALPEGGNLVELPGEDVSKAMVQVIHNSADLAADTVDVWLNDEPLIPNFAFRNASPFVELTAGTNFDITIQPKNSSDTTNGLFRKTFTLGVDKYYTLVASGIVSGSGYHPHQPFDIYAYDMARMEAGSAGETDVLVFHGSTDAPTVDVAEPNAQLKLVDDVSYGEFTGDYLNLGTADYSLQVQNMYGSEAVAQYEAPLETLGLEDSALVVVASGFLDPSSNNDGEAFGLYAALPMGGELVELPAEDVSTAMVQVIHNSADMAADTVDVWLNDEPLIPNFAFRNASPFVELTAGTNLDITIQPQNSSDTTNGLFRKTFTLGVDKQYVLVANGIVSGSGYDPHQPFDIYAYDMAQVEASESGKTDVLGFHGSTDAPTVDITETHIPSKLEDNLGYGDFSDDYISLDIDDYSLQVQDSTSRVPVAQFGALLETWGLEDSALVVLASGFLDPTQNSDGAPFGLYASLPSGGELVELPAEDFSTAKVQIIHNSADLNADTVDVWLNDELLVDNFAFRNATPFVEMIAGPIFDITVQPKTSTDTVGGLFREMGMVGADKNYVVVANGIISPSGYDPVRNFDFYPYEMGQLEASASGETDVLVFHGSTDAPAVDVKEPDLLLELVDNLEYGMFSDEYINLETGDYSLQVQDSTGRQAVAQFGAPLETLGLEDSALVLVASGFLDPSVNSSGSAFGLYAALPSGGELVELPTEDLATAKVQVIHNSADMNADTVDVWLNDEMLIDNFAFRNASPFVELTAGTEIDITIQPKTSSDTTNGLFRKAFNLATNSTNVLVANGIVAGSGYDPLKPFDIYAYNMGQVEASAAGETDVLVFHGSTDAPAVDVTEPYAQLKLVDDLSYGTFTDDYLNLATSDYSLQIQNMYGSEALAQFGAPLETLGLEDSALVVVASGFLAPANNSDGPAFGLYAALPSGGELVALPPEDVPKASVQVIHNSADLAADTVDVYLNDEILLDNFAFRNASPFVELTAGTAFDITVQPKSSTDTTSGLFKKSFMLKADSTYALVANGIVSGSGYEPLKPFDIYVYNMGQKEASAPGNTDVLVFHGSTDAPAVDVTEPFAQLKLVDDLSYGAFTDNYLNLATSDYSLQVQNMYGSEAVAQFGAPLETLGLQDSALIVVASGFLAPANNSDGPAFGLFAALPSGGELVALPSEEVSQAMVQVIHNSADAAASTVDVYLNDGILLDDFEFRTASPFVPLTAGPDLDISVQPSNSTDTVGALAKFTYQLMPDEKYVLTATGLVSSSGYEPVQPFDIKVFSGARTEASQSGNTDVLVFHGSTDAPTVDIYESAVASQTLVDNLVYGAYSEDYLELATENYTIDVQDESGSTTVESYDASLTDLGLTDSAIVVLASGFLDPSVNSDGPAFGLYVALPGGGDLVALPEAEETGLEDRMSGSTLLRVYPNPAVDELVIDINNQSKAPVMVELYNIMGQKMATPFDHIQIRGERIIRYDVSNLSEGLYFVVLRNGDSRITRKIKVIR